MIGAKLESQAGQVRWETKNVSLIVVVYLRKRPFYGLLCPTFKSTWLRLISLDKCEGEARVSSRKGKVLFSLRFEVWKCYVVEISRCLLWSCFFFFKFGNIVSIQVLFMYDWHIIVGWEGNPIKGGQIQGKLEVVTIR